MKSWTTWMFAMASLACGQLPVEVKADEAGMKSVIKDWDARSAAWLEEWEKADDSRRAILERTRPDAVDAGRKLWQELQGGLRQSWSVEGITWLLDRPAVMQGLWPKAEDRVKAGDALFTVLERYVVKSPDAAKAVPTLVVNGSARARGILEMIRAENPRKEAKGVASLGLSLLLKPAGYGAQVVRTRLTYLREAIIYAMDEPFANTTVAKVAEEELYVLNNLIPGRRAPGFTAAKAGGGKFSLEGNSGKTSLIVFWDGRKPEQAAVLKMVQEFQKKFSGRGLSSVLVSEEVPANATQLDGLDVVSDPGSKISEVYRAHRTPWSVVVNTKGEIVYAGALDMAAFLTAENQLAKAEGKVTGAEGGKSPAEEGKSIPGQVPQDTPKKKRAGIYDPSDFE